MAKDELKRFLPRGLILDLEDRMAAATVKAFQIVRDHAGLDKKRGRELEGQARFRIMEHAFEDVCELYGGQQLGGGMIPNTDLKVFQPFARFGMTGNFHTQMLVLRSVFIFTHGYYARQLFI